MRELVNEYTQEFVNELNIEAFLRKVNQILDLNLTKNLVINYLSSSGCSISSLDLSNCTNLEYLLATNNLLTTLNLSANTKLIHLKLSENRITSLDLSTCNKLQYVYLNDNAINNYVNSPSTYLEKLDVCRNPIISLDLSLNYNLTYLKFCGAAFKLLDISKNGNLEVISYDHVDKIIAKEFQKSHLNGNQKVKVVK